MKDRIAYLDIFKALAIILVVMGHVLSWCYPNFVENLPNYTYSQIVLWKFIYTFHMPLFMFVSGVVVFNPEKKYKITTVALRIITYLIPFFVIGCLLTLYRGGYKGLSEMFMRMWYFRTLSLFVLMVFTPMYIIEKFPKIGKLLQTIIVSFVFWVAAYYVLPRIGEKFPVVGDVLDFQGAHYCLYPFFLAGWLYRRLDIVRKLVENKYVYLLSFVGLFLYLIYPYHLTGYFSLTYNYVAYLAIAFFLNISIQLTNFAKAQRILGVVGTKTMEIYILHGFMATCVPVIGLFFTQVSEYGVRASMSVQLLVSVSASAIIIYLCLIIAKLIKNSDLFSLLFFGDLRIFSKTQ